MGHIENLRNVPFFNYPFVFTQHEKELTDLIIGIGRRGAFILQQELEDFERNLAAYTDAKYAIGVANGTDALIIALRAAGIGGDDEVVFASHTYVATAAAIHFSGAVPVPVECGHDHMIDVDAVAKAITAKTRAIMPTQLNGRTCDMDALQTLADKHGLLIIEDAAQGLGSRFKGKYAGSIGLVGTISFYPAKTLGSLGDGGAILTNDEEMYTKMNLLRDHGRDIEGEVVGWGLNSRLDNLQAAILDFKLSHYDNEVERRRQIASLYQADLEMLDTLLLPPAPGSEPDHFDVFQNYEIEADCRDELQVFLRKNGIGSAVQWGGKPVHKLSNLGLEHINLPFTEKMFQRCLMLPMNTSMSDDDVHYVSKTIRRFYLS